MWCDSMECVRILVESDAKNSDEMMRRKFNEEQICANLQEQEAGMATTEVCPHHDIS